MRLLFSILLLSALTAQADTNLIPFLSVQNGKAVLSIQSSNGVGNFRITGSTVTATNPVVTSGGEEPDENPALRFTNSIYADLIEYWDLDWSNRAGGSSSNALTIFGTYVNTNRGAGRAVAWTNATSCFFLAGAAKATNEITVCGWVRSPGGLSSSGVLPLVSRYRPTTDQREWELGIYNSAGTIMPFFRVSTNGATTGETTLFGLLGTNALTNWNWFAGVFDGTNLSLSVNGGALTNKATAFPSVIFSGTASLVIAAESGGNAIIGTELDEIFVWRRALTIDELQDIYALGLGGDQPSW